MSRGFRRTTELAGCQMVKDPTTGLGFPTLPTKRLGRNRGIGFEFSTSSCGKGLNSQNRNYRFSLFRIGPCGSLHYLSVC